MGSHAPFGESAPLFYFLRRALCLNPNSTIFGYVYEGLLERTVKRTEEVTLELDGTKNAKAPWVKLAELEPARLDGAERLAELLQERSGSSATSAFKQQASTYLSPSH